MAVSRSYKCFLFWVIWLIAGICLIDCSTAARAETYLRVCKKGVIYYYFTQREKMDHPKLAGSLAMDKKTPRPSFPKLSSQDLDPVVEKASRYYNLPPTLIKAIIKVESNFAPAATSSQGAQGLMQLMPSTASQLQVHNAYDIRENIWGGTRYLFLMLSKFGNSLPLALAAYNAGPHRVEKHQDIPPIKETQSFVRKVCVNFLKYEKSLSQ